MSKPIEEGCRAIISKGLYKGLEVTVGSYIGAVFGHKQQDLWEIDKPVETTNGSVVCFKSESYLKRIDDNYDGNELTTWESCD